MSEVERISTTISIPMYIKYISILSKYVFSKHLGTSIPLTFYSFASYNFITDCTLQN